MVKLNYFENTTYCSKSYIHATIWLFYPQEVVKLVWVRFHPFYCKWTKLIDNKIIYWTFTFLLTGSRMWCRRRASKRHLWTVGCRQFERIDGTLHFVYTFRVDVDNVENNVIVDNLGQFVILKTFGHFRSWHLLQILSTR